jgi:uncharacterized alkaline shock family protein YloU
VETRRNAREEAPVSEANERGGPDGDGLEGPANGPGGRIEVADQAIAKIVHGAVLSCYGIVDLAPRTLRSAIGKRFGLGDASRGIAVHVGDGRITVELSVVMEYGTPIFAVAKNVMKTVKFQLERTLGMPVERVDVNVEGLRVSAGSGFVPAGGQARGRA